MDDVWPEAYETEENAKTMMFITGGFRSTTNTQRISVWSALINKLLLPNVDVVQPNTKRLGRRCVHVLHKEKAAATNRINKNRLEREEE